MAREINRERERERERETLPNTGREGYHQKDRTTAEVVMIANGQ